MSKSQLRKKIESTKAIVKGIIDETIDLPDNAIIFDPDVLLEIFTKKRLELVQYINSCKPKSIKELADMTGRKKQAVFRDLKILERHELVSLKKIGKNVMPKVERRMAVLNMQEIYSLDIPKKVLCNKSKEEIKAQVYVDKKCVNQLIKV